MVRNIFVIYSQNNKEIVRILYFDYLEPLSIMTSEDEIKHDYEKPIIVKSSRDKEMI